MEEADQDASEYGNQGDRHLVIPESVDEEYERLIIKDIDGEDKLKIISRHQMRTAMERITKMHPLAQKLSIYDIFPVFNFLLGAKKSLSWDNFFERYERVRRTRYKPPEEIVGTPMGIQKTVKNELSKLRSKDSYDHIRVVHSPLVDFTGAIGSQND